MTAQNSDAPLSTTRADAIAEFLEGAGVAYELIVHEPVMSAGAEARITQRSPEEVAKTLVLHDGSAYVIVAVPAAGRLDIHKLRRLLGATRRLQLAGEDQIARDFPSLEVGALPPFGPMVPAAEVIDRSLLDQERILCSAGDHRHSVIVDPRDVVRVTAAKVADICED